MSRLIKSVVLLSSVILLFGSFADIKADCRLSEIADDAGKTAIIMENSFLKLIFEPSHGGRCSSLILKGSKDLVWWGPPQKIYGGVFEDHFWQQKYPGDYTDREYKYEVVANSPEIVSLKLSAIGEGSIFNGIKIEKTISIYKDKSYIDADYKIKNVLPTATARPLRFGFWMHNILRAGGPGSAENNTYYAPTTNGIRRIRYKPGTSKGDLYEYQPARGWSGVIGDSKTGVACLFDYRYLKFLYWCIDSTEYPSLEWQYNLVEVAPGESFNTHIRLIPFKGLSSIEGAGDILVGSIKAEKERYKKNETISFNLTLNSAETKDIVLETAYQILPSENFLKLESRKVSLLVNTPKNIYFNIKPQKEGTYVIRCLARTDNKEVGEFYKPVVVGKDTGDFKLVAKEDRITIKDRFEDLVPTEWRPITKPMETPHIKWAKPYAKERPKVLFLIGEDDQRELTELSQRMDIECDFMPLRGTYCYPKFRGIPGKFNKDRLKFIISKLKANRYDVILSTNLFFEEFPEEIQKSIVDNVAKGTGFVCIVPSAKTDILSEILPFSTQKPKQLWPWPKGQDGVWKKEKEHFITTGIPFSALPGSVHYRYEKIQGDTLVSSNEDPLLSVLEYKKGRIVALSYLSNRPRLLPDVGHYEVEFDYWEYYYSLLAKCILWAGKKETDLKILSLKPEGDELKRENNSWIIKKDNIISYSDEKPEVEIKLKSKKGIKGNIQLILKNKRYEIVKRYRKELNIEKNISKDIEFEIPNYLEAGLYLADILIKDKQNRILNWGTAYFKVVGNIELIEVKTDKEYYKKKEDKKNIGIALTIDNKGEKSQEASLNVEFSDCLKRRLITKTQKQTLASGTNQFKLTLHPENLIAPIHYLKVSLSDNTGSLLSDISPIYTPNHPDEGFNDYSVLLWMNSRPHYLHSCFYQLAKGIGMNGCAIAYESDSYLRLAMESNLWIHYENVPWLGCHNPIKLDNGGYIRKEGLVTHPRTFSEWKDCVEKEVKRLRKHNILFYGLGEENTLSPLFGNKNIDVCFCKHCQKAFREYLKKQYKTLEALNKQWDTSYDSWDKVIPIPYEKADKTNPSQWIDFRTFMEDEVWIEGTIKELANEIIKQDLGAYVGINASVITRDTENPFHGWNYAKAYKHDRAGILYSTGRLKLELLRSLKNHKTFTVKGYGHPESVNKYVTWHWALHGACGASYFCFASSALGFGYEWILHPNMAYCRRSMIVKEATEDLVNGVGKILINTPRYKEDEIGILYWRPSLYRSWIEDKVPYGPSYNAYFSSNKIFRSLIENLQLQYNFIIEEQALKGELNKYKVVFLPYLISPSPKILGKIDEFVKQGGVVVANMRLASCDIHGKEADYSDFLKRVFGITRQGTECSFKPVSISGIKKYQGINLLKKIRASGQDKIVPFSCQVIAKHKDNTPAITVNKYGKGYSIYLNFVPKTDIRTERLIEKILTLGGIKREVKLSKITAAGGVRREKEILDGYETFRWRKGPIEYIGILRSSGGLLKDDVSITLSHRAHLYNIRAKKYLGFVEKGDCLFASPDYQVFALLPYEVKGVSLSLKPTCKQGESLKYEVKVNGNGNIGDHVLRIEASNPDNLLSEAYTKNVIAKDGRYEDIIPLALNEKEGRWRIKVIDVISGKSVEKGFIVKK